MKKKILSLLTTFAIVTGIIQAPLTSFAAVPEEVQSPYDYGIEVSYDNKAVVGEYEQITFYASNLKQDKEYAVKIKNITANYLENKTDTFNLDKEYLCLDFTSSFSYLHKGLHQFILEMYEAPKGQNAAEKGTLVVTRTISAKVYDKNRSYLEYSSSVGADQTIFHVGEVYEFEIEILNFKEGTDLTGIFDSNSDYSLACTVPEGSKISKHLDGINEIYSISVSCKFANQTKNDFSFELLKNNVSLDKIEFSVTPVPEITAKPKISLNYNSQIKFGETSELTITVTNMRRDWTIEIPEFYDEDYNKEQFYESYSFYDQKTSTYTYDYYCSFYETENYNQAIEINIIEDDPKNGGIVKYSENKNINIKIEQPKIFGSVPSTAKLGDSFKLSTALLELDKDLWSDYQLKSDVKVKKGSNLLEITNNNKNEVSTSTVFKSKGVGIVQIEVIYSIIDSFDYMGYHEESIVKQFTKTFSIQIESSSTWKKQKGKWYYYENGKMETSSWVKSSGKWYYVDKKGVMKTSAWIKTSGKWYYVDASGKMLSNTSKKIGKTTYKFNTNGVCTNP
ncbi:MAG: putative cell wall binding protein [Oscillospiraceae bacterium]|jgi:uncharacterized protein YchJ|nr:putative cell wall binding protein [Oscillospiraceae bacterium]